MSICIVLRPELEDLKRIIKKIKYWKEEEGCGSDFSFIFVPRRTFQCDQLLEDEGLFDENRVTSFKMFMIPLEDDIFSLELPNNFAHHLMGDDDEYLVYVQESINRLQMVYGPIKYKWGLGNISKHMLGRLDSYDEVKNETSEIDGMIMIDRSVDLISPFCSG